MDSSHTVAVRLVRIATPTPVPTATPLPTPTPTVYEELLGLIPDTLETRSQAFINDHNLLREVNDVTLPGPDADVDDLIQYLVDLCDPFQGCTLGGRRS